MRHPDAGPTGDFPQGKLNAEDEGALKLAIGIEGDENGREKVVLDFGKPVAWLAFDAATAKALGHRLIRRARMIERRAER